MRKFILALISVVTIVLLPFLLLIRKYTWYELKNADRINNEIPTVNCHFGRYDELFIEIVECDWYGRDICVNGQKVVDGTVQVYPINETGDTLRFLRKKEGSLEYKCPYGNSDCWTDELNISLTYKFDSLNITYDRQLLLTLEKKWDLGFSVH